MYNERQHHTLLEQSPVRQPTHVPKYKRIDYTFHHDQHHQSWAALVVDDIKLDTGKDIE